MLVCLIIIIENIGPSASSLYLQIAQSGQFGIYPKSTSVNAPQFV